MESRAYTHVMRQVLRMLGTYFVAGCRWVRRRYAHVDAGSSSSSGRRQQTQGRALIGADERVEPRSKHDDSRRYGPHRYVETSKCLKWVVAVDC
jgi:hypothetical protein